MWLKTCTHKHKHQKAPTKPPKPRSYKYAKEQQQVKETPKPNQSNWCVSHIWRQVPHGLEMRPTGRIKGSSSQGLFSKWGWSFPGSVGYFMRCKGRPSWDCVRLIVGGLEDKPKVGKRRDQSGLGRKTGGETQGDKRDWAACKCCWSGYLSGHACTFHHCLSSTIVCLDQGISFVYADASSVSVSAR